MKLGISKIIGKNIIKLTEVNSTNLFASQLIKENNVIEGTVIIAESQTSGKGQAESKWESESGKNLTFSIILIPVFLPLASQFLLSKVVSLAIIDFLNKLSINNLTIKWPNDIYVGKQKIAGILIENMILGREYTTAIIGIGININQTQFSSNVPNPISLKLLSNKDFNIEECLNALLIEVEKRYNQLKFLKYQLIDNDYLKALYNFNKWSSYSYLSKIIIARIIGVNKYGKLILEKENNTMIECDLKEIKYVI